MFSAVSIILRPFQFIKRATIQSASIHTLSMKPANSSLLDTNIFSLTSIRTKVRCYFPRPNEVKRVRRHGWETRMSTPNGRRIIMRRLLKGRHVLSH